MRLEIGVEDITLDVVMLGLMMITMMMIVMMMRVIMKAAVLTIKHAEIAEATLTGRTAVTAGVVRTEGDISVMRMMTVITGHLMIR